MDASVLRASFSPSFLVCLLLGCQTETTAVNPESVVVVHFEGKRVPDDRPGKKATSRTFQVVRDEVVASCNRHGKVNALGEAEFWVIDDQYNEERYQYLEVTKASAMSKKWLLDLMATLKKHEH
jgi:hypothetical protein